jgi:hypothetical protein
MTMKKLFQVLAATAFVGGILGDCGTTLPPLPIPLPSAQRAPAPVHTPAMQSTAALAG